MVNIKKKRGSAPRKRKSKGAGKLSHVIFGALVALGLLWIITSVFKTKKPDVGPYEVGVEAAIANYGTEIKRLSKKYDLSPDYLMALIMLECSGRRDVPPRFEKGIYKKLQEVQSGKRTLEGISKGEIGDASDEALRNLASSWGPFQLMGYKCLHLGIQIKDLRGENSLEHGVEWINRTYGDYIRKGRYEDAFHIHNTGHPVSKPGKYNTYDKNYVPNGIRYMEHFHNKM